MNHRNTAGEGHQDTAVAEYQDIVVEEQQDIVVEEHQDIVEEPLDTVVEESMVGLGPQGGRFAADTRCMVAGFHLENSRSLAACSDIRDIGGIAALTVVGIAVAS